MKHSYLHEIYLKPDGSISIHDDERYSGWEITEINVEEPITPSITLKRYVHET